jgi:hypothetical protein
LIKTPCHPFFHEILFIQNPKIISNVFITAVFLIIIIGSFDMVPVYKVWPDETSEIIPRTNKMKLLNKLC